MFNNENILIVHHLCSSIILTIKKNISGTIKKGKSTKKQKIKDPSKKKSNKDDMPIDSGIVIVDDDLVIDKESVHEERRAYLEEARSQEASSD